MCALKVVVAMGLLVTLVAGLTALLGEDQTVRQVAGIQDLLSPSSSGPEEEKAVHERFYTVSLPGTALVVVLRAIPREEYFSYQVRAVGYEVIEREMLAAAIVLPAVDVGHVAALPASLIAFLQGKVNAVSGYAVFSDR